MKKKRNKLLLTIEEVQSIYENNPELQDKISEVFTDLELGILEPITFDYIEDIEGFRISHTDDIEYWEGIVEEEGSRSTFATKEDAVKYIAAAQLTQIAQEYNKFRTDESKSKDISFINYTQQKFFVCMKYEYDGELKEYVSRFYVKSTTETDIGGIYFLEYKHALESIENNLELWKEYFKA